MRYIQRIMKKTPTPKPVSLRITPEARLQLDRLIERTGLKEAQVIRMAIKRLWEHEEYHPPGWPGYQPKPATEAVAKPARKKR